MAPRFELVSVETATGTLHGILASPTHGNGRLVVHIHGTWGNFYGNPFISQLAEMYVSNGYKFLSANFPGHDETAISEKIEEFEPALQAWLNAVPHHQVLLQGHSLGALKILHLANSRVWSSLGVVGVALLSPFDVGKFYETQSRMDGETLRRALMKFVENNGADATVPHAIFGLWPIAASVVLSATADNSPWNQFPSSRLDVSRLSSISAPVVVALGSNDFASSPEPSQVIQLVSHQTHATAVLIEGAPHNFAGATGELTTQLSRWVATIG